MRKGYDKSGSEVPNLPPTPAPTKAGWRPDEWSAATGLSRGYFYKLLRAGKVEVVKAGKATIVTTSPADFLASLRSGGKAA
jgi:hypothetical protein